MVDADRNVTPNIAPYKQPSEYSHIRRLGKKWFPAGWQGMKQGNQFENEAVQEQYSA